MNAVARDTRERECIPPNLAKLRLSRGIFMDSPSEQSEFGTWLGSSCAVGEIVLDLVGWRGGTKISPTRLFTAFFGNVVWGQLVRG